MVRLKILREMQEVEKSAEEVIFDRLHLTAFRDGPLGFTILGPVENIQSIRQQELRNYIQRNYTPDRMVRRGTVIRQRFVGCHPVSSPAISSDSDTQVVVGVGNVNHDELVVYTEALFGETFAGLQHTGTPYRDGERGTRPDFCGAELRYHSGDARLRQYLNPNTADELEGDSRDGRGGKSGHAPVGVPVDSLSTSESPLAHFAITWEGVSWTSPDVIALMLLQATFGSFRREESQKLLSGALSGNVNVRNVVKRTRLDPAAADDESDPAEIGTPLQHQTGCDQFSAFNTCYNDTGLFGVYGACEPGALVETVEELLHGVQRLCFSITTDEIERAKRELRTTLFGTLDNTTAVAEDIGRQLLVYGKRMNVKEIEAKLAALSAADIRQVAQK